MGASPPFPKVVTVVLSAPDSTRPRCKKSRDCGGDGDDDERERKPFWHHRLSIDTHFISEAFRLLYPDIYISINIFGNLLVGKKERGSGWMMKK